MKILYTAFEGENNSSKILLDSIKSSNKLYLKNNYKDSVFDLENELITNEYDLVISFGQAPLRKNIIKIETIGQNEDKYITTYDYNNLIKNLTKYFKVIISDDAGRYLCNNLYYHGLKYIKENHLKTKMIFIHIPKIDKITKIEELSRIIKNSHK